MVGVKYRGEIMKYKCIKSFDIEGKKGNYTVNKGEIWEVHDAIRLILKRKGIGIGVMPWHIQHCFKEVAESEVDNGNDNS